MRATDAVGNWSPWTSPDSFVVDTQKPSVPQNLKITGTAGGAEFTWNASSDNIGLAEYQVRYATNNKLTGATVKSVGMTSTSVSGLAAGDWYGQVRAKDQGGNFSAWTPVVGFSVLASESGIPLEEAIACGADLIADCSVAAFDSCGDFTRKFAGMLA